MEVCLLCCSDVIQNFDSIFIADYCCWYWETKSKIYTVKWIWHYDTHTISEQNVRTSHHRITENNLPLHFIWIWIGSRIASRIWGQYTVFLERSNGDGIFHIWEWKVGTKGHRYNINTICYGIIICCEDICTWASIRPANFVHSNSCIGNSTSCNSFS